MDQLTEAINAVWHRMRWGYASVSDQDIEIEVVHRACPLPAALQLDAEVAGGFLEGVYGVWLKAAGAPDELVLEQVEGPHLPMYMSFVLSGRA